MTRRCFSLQPDRPQRAPNPEVNSRIRARRLAVPDISPWLILGFTWYCRRYIRRHFHSFRIAHAGTGPSFDGWPLLIFANHASWWDPLVGIVFRAVLFPARDSIAPST